MHLQHPSHRNWDKSSKEGTWLPMWLGNKNGSTCNPLTLWKVFVYIYIYMCVCVCVRVCVCVCARWQQQLTSSRWFSFWLLQNWERSTHTHILIIPELRKVYTHTFWLFQKWERSTHTHSDYSRTERVHRHILIIPELTQVYTHTHSDYFRTETVLKTHILIIPELKKVYRHTFWLFQNWHRSTDTFWLF